VALKNAKFKLTVVMKKSVLIILFSLFCNTLLGQVKGRNFLELVRAADSLYEAKAYLASAQTYSLAFRVGGQKATLNNFYDAACSWALSNTPDSAFIMLFKVADQKYYNLAHITNDADLIVLHNDKRWNVLLDRINDNKKSMEANFNMPIVNMLDSVFVNDQSDRDKIDEIEKKFGHNSTEMKRLEANMHIKDSINLIKVSSILDKYGWLGSETIGDRGNITLFLVIQHAESLKVQEKYLPLMRVAVKDGKAKGSNLALLEDRVALGEGKKQMYGSQVVQDSKTGKYSFSPIEDEPNVDSRRKEVGLGPLKEYARYFDIDYKLPSK
jgi:hypothetical protein